MVLQVSERLSRCCRSCVEVNSAQCQLHLYGSQIEMCHSFSSLHVSFLLRPRIPKALLRYVVIEWALKGEVQAVVARLGPSRKGFPRKAQCGEVTFTCTSLPLSSCVPLCRWSEGIVVLQTRLSGILLVSTQATCLMWTDWYTSSGSGSEVPTSSLECTY